MFRFEYSTSTGYITPIIEQKLIVLLLYSLARVVYAAITNTTLLLYDGASSKMTGSQTQSRAGMIISSAEKCRRFSLLGFGVVLESPPEI